MRKAIFTLLLFTFSASGAEMQDLPRDTRWAMHLDFRAMRGAKIVRQVAQNFFPRNSESLSSKIDAFQSILGLNLTNDLDELIYAGKGSSKSTIYLYLFGTFDVSRITAALNMQRTFTSEEYRTFSILGWQAANGVSYFLSFPRKDTAIFCRQKDWLKECLDVIAKQKEGIRFNSDFKSIFSRSSNRLFSLRVENFKDVTGNLDFWDFLKEVQIAELKIEIPSSDKAETTIMLETDKPETAQKIKQAFIGIQSLAMLRSKDAPDRAALASIAKIDFKRKHVDVDLTLNTYMATQLCKMLQVQRLQQLAELDAKDAQEYNKTAENEKKRAMHLPGR